jgi:hypothetical protein
MRSVRRVVVIVFFSGLMALQASAASAEKAPSRVQKAGAALKRAGSAARQFVRNRVGVHPNIRALKFGANLKLRQGDVHGATVMLKSPAIIASGGSFNFRERRAINGTQKKINKAWKQQKLRELGPGVPDAYNQPPPAPKPEPAHTGQYL